MAVGSEHQPCIGKTATDPRDDTLEKGQDLLGCGNLAGPKRRADQPSSNSVVDVEGHQATVPDVGAEQRELLLAVDQMGGRIHVDHDHLGSLPLEAVEEKLPEGVSHPQQVARTGAVLQPAHRRLAGQVRLGADGKLERGVGSQSRASRSVAVARGDLQGALGDEIAMAMQASLSPVLKAVGKLAEQAYALLELRQGEKARVAGKLGLVEAKEKSLAVYGLKLVFVGLILV